MKNIKETIIGVFALVGFVVIASGFSINNTTQEPTHGTPESHVWQIHSIPSPWSNHDWLYNKKTGEVISINVKTGQKEKINKWLN